MVSERRILDAYYTSDILARALVGVLPIKRGDIVLEPHVGGGAFMRALRPDTHLWINDIDPKATGLTTPRLGALDDNGKPYALIKTVGDFARRTDGRVDWTIGNPPYSAALAHVKAGLSIGRHTVYLLRLGFLESQKRKAFWEMVTQNNLLRKVWVLHERPSFTGGGTDQTAYGWFWFDNFHPGEATIDHISWKD